MFTIPGIRVHDALEWMFTFGWNLRSRCPGIRTLHAMKLYAWMRNAEITADRVGMVCCRSFDVAANTFFKLSSGITSSVFQFSVKEYLAQLDDLRSEVASQESDPEDWFSPYPFNPMRLKALEVFTKGQPYRELIGSNGGTLTADEVADQVTELMSIMEPTHLTDTGDVGDKARAYLLRAKFLVAAANGVFERSEVEALESLVGLAVSLDEIREVFNQPVDVVREQVVELSKDIAYMMTGLQRLQLIRDIVVISYADGSIDQQEIDCLVWLCENVGVNPRFIQQILTSAARGVD